MPYAVMRLVQRQRGIVLDILKLGLCIVHEFFTLLESGFEFRLFVRELVRKADGALPGEPHPLRMQR
eukprot:1391184-Pyramimonas_sp.AAC.2